MATYSADVLSHLFPSPPISYRRRHRLPHPLSIPLLSWKTFPGRLIANSTARTTHITVNGCCRQSRSIAPTQLSSLEPILHSAHGVNRFPGGAFFQQRHRNANIKASGVVNMREHPCAVSTAPDHNWELIALPRPSADGEGSASPSPRTHPAVGLGSEVSVLWALHFNHCRPYIYTHMDRLVRQWKAAAAVVQQHISLSVTL